MLTVSICDIDLQPARADCQKLLTFASKFSGLVCICEPQDWLASTVGPRTNRLWHHLHSTLLQATFYFECVCVSACVLGKEGRGGWFCCGLVSVFCCVMYHVKESKYHGDDKWAARVINFRVLTNLRSLFFFRLGFYQLYLACGGEERWWEKKKGMTHNSWTWAHNFCSLPHEAPLKL